MVKIFIDNNSVNVDNGTTIMEAAKKIGIEIPHLCYLKGLNEIAACRVCVVEVEGKNKLVTACNNYVEEGMVIFTNSPKVMIDRMRTVQMILSQHDCKCALCVRSGNCNLQKLSNELNIQEIPYQISLEQQKWDNNFPLIRDSKKCIKCMRCIQICDKVQSLNIWELEGTGSRSTVNISGSRTINDSDCSLCGQCITHCPVGALKERDDTSKLWTAIADKNITVVAQVAPAVRTAWAEELGLSIKDATINKIFDALKKIGVDYVFDTAYSADLTIMEEANEFLQRFSSGELKDRPMFTSCCPGWVRFIKGQYPHLVGQLSTAKSPMQMFGSIIKSYFAQKNNIAAENIFTVAVMPCVAKKSESERELYIDEFAGHDTDCVITTRELVRMIKSAHINPKQLQDVDADSLFEKSSGAGVIFGATGGVMEAALRTAYYKIKNENPDPTAFKIVRADDRFTEIKEANFEIDNVKLSVATVNGLGNARKLIEEIERGEKKFDFVEVMACPGGCVGGGGQPIHNEEELYFDRGTELYALDNVAKLRYSHENPDIIALYEDFLVEPNGHKSHMLLHTDHNTWKMPKSPKRDRNGYVI